MEHDSTIHYKTDYHKVHHSGSNFLHSGPPCNVIICTWLERYLTNDFDGDLKLSSMYYIEINCNNFLDLYKIIKRFNFFWRIYFYMWNKIIYINSKIAMNINNEIVNKSYYYWLIIVINHSWIMYTCTKKTFIFVVIFILTCHSVLHSTSSDKNTFLI